MRSPNQIAGFFDHYLWEECIHTLDFLHGDIHQEKVASETAISGWVCPGICSHAQTCLDLPRDCLEYFGGITRLKIIWNERLINFLVNKIIFSTIQYKQFQVIDQNLLLSKRLLDSLNTKIIKCFA